MPLGLPAGFMCMCRETDVFSLLLPYRPLLKIVLVFVTACDSLLGFCSLIMPIVFLPHRWSNVWSQVISQQLRVA